MNASLQVERARGIGGTDISAILGINPWRSPVDVWAEKTGRAAPIADNPAMRAGRMLEPVIVQMYQEDTGEIVTTGLPMVSRDGILLGHLDGLIEARGRVFEAKTARSADGWGAHNDTEVPLHYEAQVQWYCGLTELPGAEIAVLIGGSDFRIYHVAAVPDLFGEMREAALKFWRDHVEGDMAPAPRSAADAALLWPGSVARVADCDEILASKVLRLKGIKEAIKGLTEEADKIDEDVRIAFADADTLAHGGKVLATYKSQTAKRLDQTAFKAAHPALAAEFTRDSTSRVLRLK